LCISNSQAWFDFRGKRDKYADYFRNSITATQVHRHFCLELTKHFPSYGENLWGISGFRFAKRLCGLGWAAGYRAD